MSTKSTVAALAEASRLAIEHSAEPRLIEVVLDELGFIVRGRFNTGPSWLHRRLAVSYPSFALRPQSLPDTVLQMDRVLRSVEEAEQLRDRLAEHRQDG